ncbi:MAG TPA: choice-of-anchor P family protein [Pseudonocardia sp.]
MRQEETRRSTGRRALRGVAVLAMVPACGLLLATAAYADVTTVTGSAFGESVSVTTALGVAVNSGPMPTVTLPAGGSATPVVNSAASVNTPVLTTGVLNVSTQGTPGPSGSVTSSTSVTNPKVGIAVVAPNLVTATTVTSTCTSDQTGSTGSATIAGLTVLGSPVSVSTAPNSTLNIANVGILHVNEQTVTGSAPSSGITVNALRLEINAGPLGGGSIIIGQSVCGVTGTGTATPTGAVGGVMLTGLVAVAFGGYQLRRRRRPSES